MFKKKNAIFLIKLISLLLTVAAVAGVVNHFYVNGYYYYSVYSELDAMRDVPYGIKMTNVGTSHGLCSFRYDEADSTSYNLALSGSDIYHNFATLRQFADHLEPGCIVAIPTSYFSFCMPTDEPSQKRYYLYLDKDYIRGFSYETLINAKYLPVLRSGEFLIKDIIKDQEINAAEMMDDAVQSPPEAATGNTAEATEAKQAKHNELAVHAAGRCRSWRLAYMIPNEKYMEANVSVLMDMVKFCKEKGFRPVLITTPVYHSLNEAFTDGELEKYYFNNIRKAVENTGVPYLDLSHDDELSREPDYYGNSDHLNELGAEHFLLKYNEWLKGLSCTN